MVAAVGFAYHGWSHVCLLVAKLYCGFFYGTFLLLDDEPLVAAVGGADYGWSHVGFVFM